MPEQDTTQTVSDKQIITESPAVSGSSSTSKTKVMIDEIDNNNSSVDSTANGEISPQVTESGSMDLPKEKSSIKDHIRRSFHGLGHKLGLWKPQSTNQDSPDAVATSNQPGVTPIAKSGQELNNQPITTTGKELVPIANQSLDKLKQNNVAKQDPKAMDKKAKAMEEQEMLKAKKVYEEGLASLKDLIAPSSMKIDYDGLEIDSVFAQTYMVYAYPRYLDTDWLSNVINFEATVDISMFIYPINSAQILKALKVKSGQFSSSITINQEKGNVRDPALERALEDVEELRDRIQEGTEKFFQFALYFTVYAESKDKLTHIAKQLEGYLGGKLILTKVVKSRTEQGFNSCAPYGMDELVVIRNMNTGPLSTSFPFTSNELTDDKGILYGLNRINNSLIIFDRFSLPNANSVVFATSGAGKSFAVKLEILRSLMLNIDVMVIDPENEYKQLCETVGGTYINVSLNADRRINPFDLPLPVRDATEKPGDLLRQAVITLQGLMKLMLGKMTSDESAILDQALLDTYKLAGITMETENPGKMTPPTMEDLYSVLSDMKGGEDLARRLKQYTTGIFSGIFNKPTNVDLKTGMVVFSTRDLDEILRPTAIYIILNYIWNRVRSKLKKRLLIIDEAWNLMLHEDSARFIFSLVKRARKYYLGVTTITQDVDDFIGSKLGKPVVTNSSMQLLLKQAPSSIEHLKETFNLTEQEAYYLLQAGVGEGLYFVDRQHVAIQIVASLEEEKVITTNPEAILQREQHEEDFKAE